MERGETIKSCGCPRKVHTFGKIKLLAKISLQGVFLHQFNDIFRDTLILKHEMNWKASTRLAVTYYRDLADEEHRFTQRLNLIQTISLFLI
jgi:hypothetical protein